MQWREHVCLAKYTTLGVGGPARWLAEAQNESEVLEAVRFAHEQRLSLFTLGGGSNLLVSDSGFPGVVLRIALSGTSIAERGQKRIFSAGAGENWDAFVSRAVSVECSGIECLAGIPGTVGGTPVQNVGAYGQEVAETICLVRAFDLEKKEFVELPPEACGFAYRKSIFNGSRRGRYIVTRVDFALTPGGAASIRYADLQRHFSGAAAPGLAEVAAAVREIRRAKGMYLVEGDPDSATAGSFFKNPVIKARMLNAIKAAAPEGTTVPQYPAQDGCVKLSAAWLVEQSGYPKGYALGNAGISSRHTLALINRGGATAAEILRLSDLIAAAVANKFGVCLEREPVWLE